MGGENAVKTVVGKLFGCGKDEWKGRKKEIRNFADTPVDDDDFAFEVQTSDPRRIMHNVVERLAKESVSEREGFCEEEKYLFTDAQNKLDEVIEKLNKIRLNPMSPQYDRLKRELKMYSDKLLRLYNNTLLEIATSKSA